MRLIDADALKKLMEEECAEECAICCYANSGDGCRCNLIENAPTVELTEEQAIDKLHETGWLIRHDKEMTERPQGDLISRKALKEELQAQHDFYINSWKENGVEPIGIPIPDKSRIDEINTSIAMVINAPTVECVALTEEAYSDLCLRASRERPKGEWVVKEGTVACYTACNKCDYADYNHKRPNYCPNCGADMRGEEDANT